MSFPREQLSETLPTRTHVERAFWKHFAGKRKFRRQFANALPMRSFGGYSRKRVPITHLKVQQLIPLEDCVEHIELLGDNNSEDFRKHM